jgi:PBSX family phage terminase large subunit
VSTHVYEPRGACREIFLRRDPEIVLSGPAGTGKSRAALEKLHMSCMLTPRVRALIVRKTHVSMTSTALVTWREHVIPEERAAGLVRYYGGSKEEPAQYIYPNDSRVMLGGLDNPTKVMSSEYDLIYVQEAIELTEADWEALDSRLRNGRLSYQQLFGDTNPDRPTHWLKRREAQGSVVMLESRHSDNPVLVDEDGKPTKRGEAYLARLDRLTGVRRSRLRDGSWVAAEGVIYEEFDAAVHLIDRFDIPKDWERVWGVDFGFTNPFVLQCWAIDPDGRMYLYREIYRTRRRVEQHALDILRAVTDPESWVDDKGNDVDPHDWVWTEPRPTRVICDHDAEGRQTLKDTLGFTTTSADKRVTVGIEAVQDALSVEDDGPSIFFLRDSVLSIDTELLEAGRPTSTVDEVTGYVWDTGGGKVPKEAPLKVDDHGCDAMRYVVMSRIRHATSVRWL